MEFAKSHIPQEDLLVLISNWSYWFNTRIIKVFVLGVILVRIFLLSDWIYIYPYSVRMRENEG